MTFKLKKKPQHYSKNSSFVEYDDFLNQMYEMGYKYSTTCDVSDFGCMRSIYHDCLKELCLTERDLSFDYFTNNATFEKEYFYESSWTFLNFSEKFQFSKEEYEQTDFFKKAWEKQKKINDKLINSYLSKIDSYNKWHKENRDKISETIEKKNKKEIARLQKRKKQLEKEKLKVEKELKELSNA